MLYNLTRNILTHFHTGKVPFLKQIASVFFPAKTLSKELQLTVAVKSNNVSLANHLLNQGINLNDQCFEKLNLLKIAVYNRNLEMAKLLIAHGAEINLENERANRWLWDKIYNV